MTLEKHKHKTKEKYYLKDIDSGGSIIAENLDIEVAEKIECSVNSFPHLLLLFEKHLEIIHSHLPHLKDSYKSFMDETINIKFGDGKND